MAQVTKWLDKALRKHHLDEYMMQWTGQAIVENVADPSSPLWNDFTIHISLFRKMVRWCTQLFHKGIAAELASRKAELDRLLSGSIAPLCKLEDYLVLKRKRELETCVSAAAWKLRVAGFWDDVLAPSWLRARAALLLIERYNSFYMEVQRLRHAGFFDGTEYRQASVLNEDQVRAVLTNESGTIAIAGPGAGKTKMLVDRVAFYILKKNIPADSMLVLAYNKSAAKEVQERLKLAYGIDVEIRTFHSLGLKIYSMLSDAAPRSIHVEANSTRAIRGIIERKKQSDPDFQKRYTSYFMRYFDDARAHPDDAVLKEMLAVERLKPYTALDGTAVRSIAERDIANFFITHAVPFEYEPVATWCDKDPHHPDRTYHPDFYLPSRDVYLEFWAVGERVDSSLPGWFTRSAAEYRAEREWKRAQFAKHGKVLWELDYDDWRAGRIEARLEALCTRYMMPLVARSDAELVAFIDKLPNQREALSRAVQGAITSAKVAGHDAESFAEHLKRDGNALPSRDRLFFEIVVPVFEEYEQQLRASGAIDYEDMINQACWQLASKSAGDLVAAGVPAFKMIFIDEFQDISRQRLEFVKSLASLVPDCRVFCVGDDWQGIYGFAGSSSKYLVGFGEHMGRDVEMVLLRENYRNPQDVIDFGARIIASCKERTIKKALVARSNRAGGSEGDGQDKGEGKGSGGSIHVKRLDAWNENMFRQVQAEACRKLLEELVAAGVDPADIMVLSRFNFGYAKIEERLAAEKKLPVALEKAGAIVKPGVRFHSIHKSKGLEAGHVILLNVYKGQYGFPSEFAAGINLQFINPDLPDQADEERRLFFVALTRARKAVYIFTWKGNESEFLASVETSIDAVAIRRNEGRVVARVLQETEKALQLEFETRYHEKIVKWIPKSQIRSRYDARTREKQEFQLASWLVDKLASEGMAPQKPISMHV
ncbi:MAG: UvrD-helicase domain-containing protein [Candidatus Sigynarchaeota archaeon]